MKQPKDMNLDELKVLAYDMITGIERLRNDLQIINQLIVNKDKVQKPKEPEKKE